MGFPAPHPVRRRLIATIVVAVLIGPSGGRPSDGSTDAAAASVPPPVADCCPAPAHPIAPAVAPTPRIALTHPGERAARPDVTADEVGGIAARLHTADGERVPGHVFLLVGAAGLDAPVRLYDRTPYVHDHGGFADTHESNVAARAAVEAVTGTPVDLLEFTTAPGGGPSGGLTYAIAYLNIVSDGAFSGDLRIAATGRLDLDGYVDPINAIDEKTAAAHVAGADVLFTPSVPSAPHLDAYGDRHVGQRHRARYTGNPLREERRLDHYRAWGAERPDGLDIVHVRHLGDVAAYLCGAGSDHACAIADAIGDDRTGHTDVFAGDDRTGAARESSAVR